MARFGADCGALKMYEAKRPRQLCNYNFLVLRSNISTFDLVSFFHVPRILES